MKAAAYSPSSLLIPGILLYTLCILALLSLQQTHDQTFSAPLFTHIQVGVPKHIDVHTLRRISESILAQRLRHIHCGVTIKI